MIQYDVLKDLVEIKTKNNKTLLHDLVEMFSQKTPQRLNQLEQAIKLKNKDEIAQTAHALKSSCSYLGIEDMVYSCAQLENWAAQENFKKAQIELSAIEDSYEESLEELNQYLGFVFH